MSRSLLVSRRRWLRWMGAAAGMAAFPAIAEEEKPQDRGIGGTGITSKPEAGLDRSIGFMGSIQRFGSIFVNDARIAYPKNVIVRIDGFEGSARNLKIGQVVRTIASGAEGALSTQHIEVISEVVGAIESVSSSEMVVLGQSVIVDAATRPQWLRIGLRVAVSGIRRTDGAIVAGLVEQAGARSDQIVGTATLKGWLLQIGATKLLGIDPNLAGRRIIVQGAPGARGLIVSHARPDTLPTGPNVDRLSIEAYVSRDVASESSGSGSTFGGTRSSTTAEVRAVLSADVASSGQVEFDSIRIEAGKALVDAIRSSHPLSAMPMPGFANNALRPFAPTLPGFGSPIGGQTSVPPPGFPGGLPMPTRR